MHKHTLCIYVLCIHNALVDLVHMYLSVRLNACTKHCYNYVL